MTVTKIADEWERLPIDFLAAVKSLREWFEGVNVEGVEGLGDSISFLWEVAPVLNESPMDAFTDLLMLALNDSTVFDEPGLGALDVPYLLAELFAYAEDDDDATLGVIVATNPNCGEALLTAMARSDLEWEDYAVSSSVAANKATPAHLLEELSRHEEAYVRWAVASNPHTPLSALKGLSLDQEVNTQLQYAELPSQICVAVSTNEATTAELLHVQREYANSLVPQYASDDWAEKWLQVIHVRLSDLK